MKFDFDTVELTTNDLRDIISNMEKDWQLENDVVTDYEFEYHLNEMVKSKRK